MAYARQMHGSNELLMLRLRNHVWDSTAVSCLGGLVLYGYSNRRLSNTSPHAPRVSRIARGHERCLSVVTDAGVWPTTAMACLKNSLATSLSRFSALSRINQVAIVINGTLDIAPLPMNLEIGLGNVPGCSSLTPSFCP